MYQHFLTASSRVSWPLKVCNEEQRWATLFILFMWEKKFSIRGLENIWDLNANPNLNLLMQVLTRIV